MNFIAKVLFYNDKLQTITMPIQSLIGPFPEFSLKKCLKNTPLCKSVLNFAIVGTRVPFAMASHEFHVITLERRIIIQFSLRQILTRGYEDISKS